MKQASPDTLGTTQTTRTSQRTEKRDSERPLVEDIRLLGRILGDVIRTQEGPEAYELVEQIRKLSVAFRRDADHEADKALKKLLKSLSGDQTVSVIRAFTYFSHLANLAEDRHHIRRRAVHERAGDLQEGSLARTLQRLHKAGIAPADVVRTLAQAARVARQWEAPPTPRQLGDGLHAYVCGSGSPMPDADRAGPCIAVLAGNQAFVFDAGSGAIRKLLRMGFPIDKLQAGFLTHLHSDHIDGLGELLLQAWVGGSRGAPLPVFGPAGTAQVLDGLQEGERVVLNPGDAVADGVRLQED